MTELIINSFGLWDRLDVRREVLDAENRVVPEMHREIFHQREKIYRWCLKLMWMRRWLLAVSRQPEAMMIPVKRITDRLQLCIVETVAGLPFEPCDCQITDLNECPKCQNRRWLPDPLAVYSSAESSASKKESIPETPNGDRC